MYIIYYWVIPQLSMNVYYLLLGDSLIINECILFIIVLFLNYQ